MSAVAGVHRAELIDADGPVRASRELEIAAPIEVVWGVLTDFEAWPRWNPEVRSMALDGGVSEGSVFRWKSGPGTITSTIQCVQAPRAIAWTGKTLSIRALHAWRLEATDAGTLVRTEEAFGGLLARLLAKSLQKTLETALEDGLVHLRAEAERLATRPVAR